jgi:hypothetical protein
MSVTPELMAKFDAWSAEAPSLQITNSSFHATKLLADHDPAHCSTDRAHDIDQRLAIWWVQTLGISDSKEQENLRRKGYGRLAVLACPDASHDVAFWVAQDFLCGFEIDDLELEPQLNRNSLHFHQRVLSLQAALTHPRNLSTTADPVADALRNLMVRAEELTSPRIVELIRASWYKFLIGATCEDAYISAGAVPDLDDYLRIRLLTLGDHAAFMTMFAGGFDLPGAIENHPDVRGLTTAAHLMIGYCNDILTCRSELAKSLQGRLCFNAPIVIAYHRGCPLQEALNETARLHNTAATKFNHHAELLNTTATAPARTELLDRYIRGITQIVRGWQEWTAHTVRYSTLSP